MMSLKTLYQIWRLNSLATLPNRFTQSRYFITSTIRCVSYVYNITFETGDKFGAGTDSNVFVRLVGDYGSTEEMEISARQKDMERGMTNTYRLATDYVGPLQKLIVRHDSSGVGAAWYLEKVTVRDAKGASYTFPCASWLSKTSASDAIKLLRPEQSSNDTPSDGKKISHPLEKSTSVKPQPVTNSNKSADQLKASVKDASNIITPADRSGSDPKVSADVLQSSTHSDSSIQSTRHAESLSPSVRFLRDTYAIDLNNVVATGPQARVVKGDVLVYMQRENITEPVKFDLNEFSEPLQGAQLADIIIQPSAEIPVANEVKESLVSKFDKPHLYMTSSCNLDGLRKHLNALAYTNSSKEELETAFITCLFTRTLQKILKNDNDFTVRVNNDNHTIFSHSNDDIDTTILKVQQREDVSHTTFAYGLDICLDSDGVTQLSSVLDSHCSLVLNISGEKIDLNIDGSICRTCTLSLTFDGRHISENNAALLLENIKKFIEKPELIGL